MMNSMPSYNEFLHMLRLKITCIPTIWRWLIYLGYKYDENQRNYYADGHKREDIVQDRNEIFLVDYFSVKCHCYRWVQLQDTNAILLETSDTTFPRNCSYNYSTENRTTILLREYQVDMQPTLENYVVDNCKQYNFSERMNKNTRPLILVGQDENTYHQFVFSKKHWKVPSILNIILPKGEGKILMIFLFSKSGVWTRSWFLFVSWYLFWNQ